MATYLPLSCPLASPAKGKKRGRIELGTSFLALGCKVVEDGCRSSVCGFLPICG